MTQVNLEDVESYLVEKTNGIVIVYTGPEIEQWLRNRFAELRAREEAKTHVK